MPDLSAYELDILRLAAGLPQESVTGLPSFAVERLHRIGLLGRELREGALQYFTTPAGIEAIRAAEEGDGNG